MPLDSLALDPGNVHKTGVSDRATAELAASIASIGLINPLGCFETNDAGQTETGNAGFSVVAGGRRLAALKQLAADGTMPASLAAGIPIVVFKTRDELTEISLAENIVRADMSAADQITDFGVGGERDEIDVGSGYYNRKPVWFRRFDADGDGDTDTVLYDNAKGNGGIYAILLDYDEVLTRDDFGFR